MSQLLRRGFFIIGLILLPLSIGGTMLIQASPECLQGEVPTGCIQITLYPDGVSGDFYVDGVLAAEDQNPGWLLVTPGVEHIIEVKNIRSTEAGFGTLFTYADVSTTLKVGAGETGIRTIWLTKSYIRGTLKFTCDVRNAAPDDAVSCRVAIDGVVQTDMAGGQTTSYFLDPGEHIMLVEIIGEQAGLFDPASVEKSVGISAGRTAIWRGIFVKKGHLFVSLDEPDVTADFFVNGAQVATQAAGFDMWVTPNRYHKVEVKNFTDPAAGGIYTWRDVRQYVSAWAGKERTITVRLRKQYLKGFLVVKCNVSDAPDAYCVPAIDDVEQPAIDAGASAQYTLAPGWHSVVVVPGPVGSWRPASVSRKVSVWAGGTQTVSVWFREVQASPSPEPSAGPTSGDYLPILTMGGCNTEERGYRWGPSNLATRAGFESKALMMTMWAPTECRPDTSDPTHPPRSLTVAECAVFYYRPRTLVLFPNRPFDGNAYYDDVARLIRHIESYENEIGLARSKKIVMGPVSHEGGVIGSPYTVIALGAGVIDLPDIIRKTSDATGYAAASDNVHLIPSLYFFGIVDKVVHKAIAGAAGIYTIEPAEIPPVTP
ncbi:MAG: hypothetical protein JXB30_12415 [Anaerolineae bacterium]|nr:hypothetical protein [Anaerolineae bacterium]